MSSMFYELFWIKIAFFSNKIIHWKFLQFKKIHFFAKQAANCNWNCTKLSLHTCLTVPKQGRNTSVNLEFLFVSFFVYPLYIYLYFQVLITNYWYNSQYQLHYHLAVVSTYPASPLIFRVRRHFSWLGLGIFFSCVCNSINTRLFVQ